MKFDFGILNQREVIEFPLALIVLLNCNMRILHFMGIICWILFEKYL